MKFYSPKQKYAGQIIFVNGKSPLALNAGELFTASELATWAPKDWATLMDVVHVARPHHLGYEPLKIDDGRKVGRFLNQYAKDFIY